MPLNRMRSRLEKSHKLNKNQHSTGSTSRNTKTQQLTAIIGLIHK